MKKFMVLFMMVAMVMGFSLNVMAFEGNIIEEGNQTFTIDAEVEIGPWSRIAVTQDKTWFVEDRGADPLVGLPLSGEYGLYTNDGSVFRGLVEDAFHVPADSYTPPHVEQGEDPIETNTNLGRIEVETNTPLMMTYTWNPTDWLNSPTVFGVFDRTHRQADGTGDKGFLGFNQNQSGLPAYLGVLGQYGLGSYVGFFGDVDSGFEDGNEFNARAQGINNYSEVVMGFQQCTTREFDLMMGLYIEKITQQEARLYEGQVDITVAALETVL